MQRNVPSVVALLALVLVAACAPSAPSRSTAVSEESPGETAPKVLTIGIQTEPTAIVAFLGGRQFIGGGAPNLDFILHSELVVENDTGAYEPRLAAEQISIEKGTWRLNPDGTMDTVWTLRPNVKWHDGTPFTSADLLFALELFQDPETASTTGSSFLPYIESATAPDSTTFTIHWSNLYAEANQLTVGTILPSALLRELYINDKQAFLASSLLSTQFIGLGPYRLANWELGSHMETLRFDDYFEGRPRFDRVIVRFLGDPNTMVANILSGTVDVLLPAGISLDAALELKDRWEGTGNQVRFDATDKLLQLEIQHQPEFAMPTNGMTNLAVRQAFYQAVDKEAVVEVASAGMSPIADSWIRPNHELRRRVESAIPQFPYDMARARQPLSDAGWTHGSDGVLVHSSGERFDLELWAIAAQAPNAEQTLNVIAEGWKALGANVILNTVPRARASDYEYMASHPGPLLTDPSGERLYKDRLYTRNIPSASTRWLGLNRGGYTNPKVDALYDALATTIDAEQQIQLHRNLLQEMMSDVALIPLYWGVQPIPMLKGVSGPKHVRNTSTWNIFQWDKE